MKVDDFVWVSEEYNPKTMKLDKIEKSLRKIVRTQELPTFGKIYLLAEKDGTIMRIWYYESQLEPASTSEDEEEMWKTWGDI